MSSPRPTAFNAFASAYDQSFTNTALGKLLRSRVWNVLHDLFQPGHHILELACGTGVDALWLARRGVHVTATDGSPSMVRVVEQKVHEAGLTPFVTARCHSLQQLSEMQWPDPPPFDGAFSNFGGLNTIPQWSRLARSLAQAVRPGGALVLVPMGPYCPWELLWHAVHGEWDTARRRLRQPAAARIGEETIPIWYPSSRRLKRDFAPWFQHRATRSLGLLLPPSYLGHLVERHPRFFAPLNRLEAATARLTSGWGDHYISVFVRNSTPSNKSVMR